MLYSVIRYSNPAVNVTFIIKAIVYFYYIISSRNIFQNLLCSGAVEAPVKSDLQDSLAAVQETFASESFWSEARLCQQFLLD